MSPIDETEIDQNRLSFLDHKSRRSVSQTTRKYYYQVLTEITDQHASFSPFRTNAVILETIYITYFVSMQFDRNEHFSPFEFSSAEIKIDVNSGSVNNLGWPYNSN